MSHPQRHAKMSLETALDEERREVLDILEGRNPRPSIATQKNRRASPMPAVRSLLDISTDAPPRHGSIAGIGVGITPSSGKGAPVRSLVEPPTPSPLRLSHSAASSPTSPRDTVLSSSSRRSSDSTSYPAADPRRKPGERQGVDIGTDYKFEMLPSIPNQALPKRVTQGGFTRGRDMGRQNSTAGVPSHSSRSPSSRLGRSLSPVDRLLNASSLNLLATPGKFVTDNGKVIDMDHAYKRLSNAALSRSGGSLAILHSRNSSSREQGESGESLGEEGDVRLEKDHYGDEENGSEAVETSEEEVDDTSSGEDDPRTGVPRGRCRGRKKLSHCGNSEQNGGADAAKETKEPQSLLAAAEKERQQVASTYKVKSLLEPEPPKPAKGDTLKSAIKKTGVHPHTSFDYTASAINTPVGSDEEADLSDIKQAQNLSIHMSAIDNSIPNRAIRTIIRGDFTRIQQDADEGRRRQRKYLVATDLSDESVYALEWTIGTILRDGDTLFAVYAVDEDTGTGSKDAELSSSVQIGEGVKVIQDTAAVVGSQTEKTAKSAALSLPHMLTQHLGSGWDSKSGSVDSRGMSKAEMERFHAVEGISQTCVRLLRKTMLQVRVAVEVIHCKSPKHLITEAIDGLEPTLVILGSRGRSALKGVLLGSFSNYLVAKSSVPVMVARKKLKKHAKYKSTNIRLSNNLTTPKKLALAKVD
ncbi:hypothetical protein VTN00DRAFT_6834 [Thermoascus crustaceus]|uniref:uncharacterized protein n=1 Tax=Thermoascus crustaceus TaxID=5088 RepID=UPI003743DE75